MAARASRLAQQQLNTLAEYDRTTVDWTSLGRTTAVRLNSRNIRSYVIFGDLAARFRFNV
jgi:hypothetical protein